MAREPTVSRPGFDPSYGISTDSEGMLDWTWAVERLEAARNYWISTTCEDGAPHAAPVWGLWVDDAVLFGTATGSVKGRNLARDPRVTVHLESGDEVVILDGEAEAVGIDEQVADAYESKYEFRPEPAEVGSGWYRVRPRVAFAWLEQDYTKSATRFSFERG